MGKELQLDPNFQKTHWCNNKDITLQISESINLSHVLRNQDRIADGLIEKVSKDTRPVYYYGIAHTPLIFRLGYLLAGKTVHFLHGYRDGKTTSLFSELSKADEDIMPFNIACETTVPGATDLLVGIGATYSIQDTELDTIDPKHIMYRYMINIDEKLQGVDFFNSEYKLNSFAKRLIIDIESICKNNRIKKVHIAISASTAFTFLLGQRFNTNQMPDIIVYHYESGFYTWGILIKENNADKAVIIVTNGNR